MNIKVSSVCQAFNNNCIGTKVTHEAEFRHELAHALVAYDMPANGQGFIPLANVSPYVLSGDCERAGLTEKDYVVRLWRGEMMMFAKRREQRATFCAAIVYTAEAYFADPQVDEAEKARLEGATHVLVAVLGSRGPKPTLSSSRFVRNLAGGNASFAHMGHQALVEMAKAIEAYEAEWVVVADPAGE